MTTIEVADRRTELTAFAGAIRSAVAQVGTAPTERFGARKVFVSAVFRQLASGEHAPSLDGFKASLIEAQRVGLLELARADLVAAMPTDAVAASEIEFRGSQFHFVIDSGARDPWAAA